MSVKKQLQSASESASVLIAVILLNILLSPEDPGFSKILYTPYVMAALFSAAYFGRPYGFGTLLLSVASTISYSTINSTISKTGFHSTDTVILAAAIIFVYIFGTIRETDRLKIENLRKHHKQAVKDFYLTKRISEAQLEINRELEDRVSGQRATITTLYNQMHRIDSLNLGKSLDILLETIRLFTEATAITVWAKSPTAGYLYAPAALRTNEEFEPSMLLGIEDSIEGWVFRNNRIVSARMINNYENLAKMDSGRNLITMPIQLNNKVWGVLNIGEMPFVKYNSYTERLLEIIISLAKPSLARAVEHERQISQSETDSDTNLPLYSQLYNKLNRFIGNAPEPNTRLSLLIIEMHNYSELINRHPATEIKRLFLGLIDEIMMTSAGQAEFFMYKEDNQLAVIIPGLANDGASLLCLEILELVNSANWTVNDDRIYLEVIIGYSSLGDNAEDVDGLLDRAEHLLEIQKI